MNKPSRWIPTGSRAIEAADIPAVVYVYEANGTPCALGYSGAKSKHDFHNSYRRTDREAHIAQYFANLRAHKAMMAERKASRLAYQHTLQVGDILYSSWGYDQTNIDFYQVVQVAGRNVVIRELAQRGIDATGYMSGHCAPIADKFAGEPMTKRVKEGNTVKIESYAYAWPWDGKPKHWTGYA